MPQPNFQIYGRNKYVFIHHMLYLIFMVTSLLWGIKKRNVFIVLFQRSLIKIKQNKFILNIFISFFFLKSCKNFLLHIVLMKFNLENFVLKAFLRLNFPEGFILQITSERKYYHYTMAFKYLKLNPITLFTYYFFPTQTL